ncbi:MAG: STAS domain-containing protein (plasmid) [Leptolyngbya sp. BL-A-14]
MTFDPQSPTIRTLQIKRVLDGVQGSELRQTVKALVQSGVTTVLLDCQDVTFIDSVGLSSLLECHKTLQQAGGELCLSHCNATIHGLLELTNLDTVLTVL